MNDVCTALFGNMDPEDRVCAAVCQLAAKADAAAFDAAARTRDPVLLGAFSGLVAAARNLAEVAAAAVGREGAAEYPLGELGRNAARLAARTEELFELGERAR